MADVRERPQAATFDWHDAVPSDADNMELLLAKYARLQFVHQVRDQRRRRSDCVGDPAASVPQALASKRVSASNPSAPAHEPASGSKLHGDTVSRQLPSINQSPQASKPTEEVNEACAAFHNCRTPYHSMLPAPGANMLSAANPARARLPPSSAETRSPQDDPIVATAWQSRKQPGYGIQARRKASSKTWTTLNLQQATSGAQHAGHAVESHADRATSSTNEVLDAAASHLHGRCNQQTIKHDSGNGLGYASGSFSRARSPELGKSEEERMCGIIQLETAMHQSANLQEDTHSSMQSKERCSGTAQQIGHIMCEDNSNLQLPKSPAPAEQTNQEQKPPLATAAFLPHLLSLEGSETQPELALPCIDDRPAGTQSKHATDAKEPAVTSHLCQLHSAAVPSEGVTGLPCENVPDSSGNSFLVSQRLSGIMGQPEDGVPLHDASHTADCESQQAQGWHVQLDNVVLALLSCDRYLAVYNGGKQEQYQLTVLNVGAQVPQVHCNMKLHAAQLPAEPWNAVNCMQLQLVRNEPMLVMSSLLQPEDIEAPLEGGVSIWRFRQQQAELACHLSSDTPANCVLTAHGMIAAAGEGSWLRLWQLDSQLVSQGQTSMAPAKYKGLGFPDIVQLAFPDTACQLIAGCSSTGLLAIWSIRGDLLMAHCHPLFMVQSIYQPPDKQLASQAHSPEVLVVLAKIQQHPNSQQQGRKPLQSLVALVVTHDNLFVGANIGPKQ
ncbi:TPA: hypothetical protein ACH3X3_013247 [Trebouxia sp. C0006]